LQNDGYQYQRKAAAWRPAFFDEGRTMEQTSLSPNTNAGGVATKEGIMRDNSMKTPFFGIMRGSYGYRILDTAKSTF
jgi:hypothetical protein